VQQVIWLDYLPVGLLVGARPYGATSRAAPAKRMPPNDYLVRNPPPGNQFIGLK
jgi:hypothetical protein